MLTEYRIGIGIGEDRNGHPISDRERENAIEHISFAAASRFGGYNLQHGQGGWINPDGRLVTEPTITLTIIAPADGESFHQALTFAHYAAQHLRQHSFTLADTASGEARIIETDPAIATGIPA